MTDKSKVTWIQTTPLLTQLMQKVAELEARISNLENPAQPKVRKC